MPNKLSDIKMTTTALVTTIIVITLAVYDLVCVLTPSGTSVSVSRFLINVGFTSPMVVFGFGFCAGHIFGYAKIVRAEDLDGKR